MAAFLCAQGVISGGMVISAGRRGKDILRSGKRGREKFATEVTESTEGVVREGMRFKENIQ